MSKQRLVCSGCSLLCDGLTSDSDTNIPVEVAKCQVAVDWYSKRSTETESPDLPVSKIREMLNAAKLPLITGLETLSVKAQQAAVKVADRYHAAIDTSWSNAGRGSMASFQRYGKVTATLGEVTNRSDLVVLWYCDPESTHPRFIERFVRNPDRPKKQLIVIDESKTATAAMADQFIELPAGSAAEFVQELRGALKGKDVESDFANTLATSNYGCVVLGKPKGTEARFDLATDQWFQLVNVLNDRTRFVMTSLRNDRNGISANNVLTAMCGFPDSVRFTESGPIWNGLEYSTGSLTSRRECDLLFVCDVGQNEPFEADLDSQTISWLKTIPVVVISDLSANNYSTADVYVACGTPGWTTSGDFVRTDDIPIPMSAASGVEIPGALDLFEQLLSR